VTRSGTIGSVPSTSPPLSLPGMATPPRSTLHSTAVRSHAHEEFTTAVLDQSFFLSLATIITPAQIAAKEPEKLRAFVAWLLVPRRATRQTRQPRGVEEWKGAAATFTISYARDTRRDGPADHKQLAQTAMDLGLPHPVHIHFNISASPELENNAGHDGSARKGRRAHLTHIQFHSYAANRQSAAFASQVPALAEYVNTHPNLTVDVGQSVRDHTS